MPLQRVPINSFRGGLNTRDSPFELQPNESPDLRNVTLSALVGQLQVRAGKTRLDLNQPAAAVDYMLQVNIGGSNLQLMCSIGGSIYAMSPAGTYTKLFNGTAGTVWSFALMPDAAQVDHVWCCNGTDAPQKWDGSAGSTSAWAGTPPNGNVLQVWKNRMCMAGVSTWSTKPALNMLFLSPATLGVPVDPENTSTNGWDNIIFTSQSDESDSITDLNVFKDWLFVFKRRSTWFVSDPATLNNKRIGNVGAYSRFQSAPCLIDDKLYFFNEQGIWSTAGASIQYEAGSIQNWFPTNMNLAQVAKARMICTNEQYPRILVAVPTGTSTRNSIMIELLPLMNFRRIGGRRYLLLPAFMLHTFACDSIANMELSNQWRVVGGDSTINRTYIYFYGLADDGVAINAYWKSAWMAIQGEEPFERVRRLNIELSGDCTVEVYGDFRATPDFTGTVPITNAGWDPGGPNSVWDDGLAWDDGTAWDPQALYRFARLRPESRARFHQVNLISGANPYKINIVELAIRGGKEH